MAATTMVHIRVDETLKAQAADTLAAMGLSLSDAVRVFLTRVVAEQRLPFALKAPNAETRAALAEAETIIGARNVAQLEAALASLNIPMTADLYRELSSLSPTPPPATDRNDELLS